MTELLSLGFAQNLLRFHVKHAIASVATERLRAGMTEREHVGLEESKHTIASK